VLCRAPMPRRRAVSARVLKSVEEYSKMIRARGALNMSSRTVCRDGVAADMPFREAI